MKRLILLILLFCSSSVMSHRGGLDNNGGHYDKKTGDYHCHREACFKNQKQYKSASPDIIKKNRNSSYVYNRSDWKHWSDSDSDCMNTRHEILKDQADGPVKLSGNGCSVRSGLWYGPFSGKAFTLASDLDIDHIIPLKWANDHGGSGWPETLKEQFANDPVNLLAVDDSLNQAKGAKGPSEWMPPNQNFRCEYLQLWQKVLTKYPDLKMHNQEKRVYDKQLRACV